jgi:hypothetical protein
MILIDESDTATNEQMSILCKDDLNFKLDLEMRSSIKFSNVEVLRQIIKKQGSKMKWGDGVGYLSYVTIYNTYVKQVARSITRSVVSKYATVSIRDAREEIQETIKTKILEATKNLPVKIDMVVTNNFDYPDIITQAVERKKEQELQIEAERARLEMELNRMDNKLRLANKQEQLLTKQAENDAIRMKILNNIITPEFIALRNAENQQLLIESLDKVDTVILNNSDATMAIPTDSQTSNQTSN